jgi:hypothetical protein
MGAYVSLLNQVSSAFIYHTDDFAKITPEIFRGMYIMQMKFCS